MKNIPSNVLKRQSNIDEKIKVSVCLNDYGYKHSLFGFKSWLLQDYGYPYQVIMNIINKEYVDKYEELTKNKSDNCIAKVNFVDDKKDFNIAKLNNIGLHYSKDTEYTCFSEPDIVYSKYFLKNLVSFVEEEELPYCVVGRYKLTLEYKNLIKKNPNDYDLDENFEELFKEVKETEKNNLELITWGFSLGQTKLFYQLGGFDNRLITHSDADMDKRMSEYCRSEDINPMSDFRFTKFFYGLQLFVENQDFKDKIWNKYGNRCGRIVEGKKIDDYYVGNDLEKLGVN